MSGEFQHVLPADVRAPGLIRGRLRGWLGRLNWPTEESQDLLLAVSEAVSNAAEHAYRPGESGPIEVLVAPPAESEGSRTLTVTVTDHGHWRPPPAHREGRRRGIPLMRVLTQLLYIDGGVSGTRVTMSSRPVPAPTA
jgi:serine/threonine-protein kinase RsbW